MLKLRYVAALAAVLAFISVHCVAAEVGQPQIRFSVEPQPLREALAKWSEQAGMSVVLAAGQPAASRMAPRVEGMYAAEHALELLVAGSGLRIDVIDSRTFALRPANSVSQAKRITMANGDEHSMRVVQNDSPSSSSSSSSSSLPEEQSTALDEIIVTAQKRSERLQDVPVPVTALSSDELVNSNQLRLQEYYNRIPNLNVTTGSFHGLQLTIRGLTTGGGNPTVGIVIDDLPYGSTRGTSFGLEAPDLDPSTLQQVEVLRGPQGTLYGAGSMGGLLKFVTVPPSVSGFSGRIQGGLSGVRNGSQAGYNVRGAVNIPISETLALRASAFTRQDPGYIDNPILGLEGINEAAFSGGRVSALWTISPQWSLNLSALLQQSNVDGTSEVQIRPGLQDLEQDTVRGSGAYDKTIQAYSATLSAALGAATLTSLSGFNISRFDDVTDFSVAIGSGAVVLDDYRTEKFSQEVRLSVPVLDKLQWLFGAFYTEENTDTAIQRILQANRATGALGAETFSVNAPQRFEEHAFFSNLTVGFSDRFDVQFGARYGKNQQSYQSVNGLSGVVSPKIETEDDSFTYLVTPRLKLTSDVMVYARLASGYRPGGPNTNVALLGLPTQAYEPDQTKNYEIGAKGDLMDGMLSFDASLYRIDWEDIQIQIRSGGFTFYTNGSKARSQGVELSWELRPYPGLTISGWGARTLAELSEPLPATATVFGTKGDRLPYGSKFSGRLSLDQTFPISAALEGDVGLSVNYVGERLGAFRGLAAGVPLPRQEFPSYTKIDFRAGVRMGEWSADLFLNNLTDRRGLLQGGLGQTDPTSFYYIQPRTYGFSVAKSF